VLIGQLRQSTFNFQSFEPMSNRIWTELKLLMLAKKMRWRVRRNPGSGASLTGTCVIECQWRAMRRHPATAYLPRDNAG